MTISRPAPRKQLDMSSLILVFIGLSFGSYSYFLITTQDFNPLILVPSVVSFTLGVTALVKRVAPRE